LFWAHFRRFAPETGLSACIFFAAGKKGRARRRMDFNPLRIRREELFSKGNNGKGPVKRTLRFYAFILLGDRDLTLRH
jgi:hypothetical protein